MNTQTYFENLKSEIDKVYAVAQTAREKGYDPADKVEIPLAMNMAEKVVGIISTIYPQMEGTGIADRISELEKEYGKLDATVSFKIAEEVSKQKFCNFDNTLQAMEAGIRVGFGYQTIGVVSSPIEGFTGLKVRKTHDGKEYIEASFSGPIRSAGTTASCVVLMIIDYLRELFGFSKYDPTEDESKRVWTELEHFHDRISNLQGMPTEEETLYLARRMPIQVAGDASEKVEVPNYKNLERVDTNFLRSGFCLIMAEGLAQKARKGFGLYNNAKKNGIKMTGFDWLDGYIELQDKRNKGKIKTADAVPPYIKDLVAGRPIFGHPSRSGGFRFRYGRGRNSGFSAASLHPATMGITDNFIAVGTQLKIEKPTKGCAVSVCDSIDGPIIKLFNGSVKKIKTKEEAKKYYSDTEEIIYLGDILFPFSDVKNRFYELLKPGYVEEWWELELREKNPEENINGFDIGFDKAIEIGLKYKIPLNPQFIFYWNQINKVQFEALIEWLKNSIFEGKLIFPYLKSDQDKFSSGKRALELLGIEHEVTIENVVVDSITSRALLFNLGLEFGLDREKNLREEISSKNYNFENEDILGEVNKFSSLEIKDKSGDFIGSRMGRPEKAKLRKLTGSPNILFPVGSEGGRLRSLNAACVVGKVHSSFPLNYCESCDKDTIYESCEKCGKKAKAVYYFPQSKERSFSKRIESSDKEGLRYSNRSVDVKYYYEKALEKLGITSSEAPVLIKGIRGTSSGEHKMEHLVKGILRAKYGLQVNKDGTIRVDATELPLIYFKPKEISVSIEKLIEIGYDKDIHDNPLENENQILELMPHDIVLPCSPDSLDEKCDDVFIKVSKFVDELLVKFYGVGGFYNVKTKEDLVGKLGVFMAPHNCAGVVCRFIGFSKTQGLLASPYMHAAVRRDCDGDEAAIMLLGDVLLNFSRGFLPSHRGGTQDAPLVLNAKIDAGEVDDQILDLEMCMNYPLELYHLAEQRKHSSDVKTIPIVKKILKEGKDPFRNIGFTHNTDDFNDGVLCSSYKLLATMQDKVQHQMGLVEKLRCVDAPDTARLIIERHFIRDMRGNLRKFSQQEFRCVACNEIIRRPPLNGICTSCGGKLIFTIHEGGIKKYLEPALDLAKRYNLSSYLQQSLELVKGYIDSIFGKETEKQETISKWF
jgi:DNA polymerase II large subunit